MHQWVKVVFSGDCDDDGNCPKCSIDYADCGCPVPTMDELYEYKFDEDNIMWAKKKSEQ